MPLAVYVYEASGAFEIGIRGVEYCWRLITLEVRLTTRYDKLDFTPQFGFITKFYACLNKISHSCVCSSTFESHFLWFIDCGLDLQCCFPRGHARRHAQVSSLFLHSASQLWMYFAHELVSFLEFCGRGFNLILSSCLM